VADPRPAAVRRDVLSGRLGRMHIRPSYASDAAKPFSDRNVS
jgi:hypothetical protein